MRLPKLRSIWVLAILFSNKSYAEVSVSVLIAPKYQAYSSESLFDVPKTFIKNPTITSDNTLELTGDAANQLIELNYLFSIHTIQSDTSKPEIANNTNELFISKGISSWDFTLGRKIDSWGVGYGFRPLDVVQQFDQQTTARRSLIGINRLSAEYFFDIASWTLMWIDPMQKPANKHEQQQEAIVTKFSTSTDNYDLHLISKYNKENKLQFGVGGVNIINNTLSLHGSILYSQQYKKKLHRLIYAPIQPKQLLTADYPYFDRIYNNGLQATLGLNWNSKNKHGIIAEYWYNDFAYSNQQWKRHYSLAKQQQALLEQTTLPKASIYGNIAWMANATQTRYLAQHNLMLRWNYNAEYWKPTAYIIFSPADSSNMITLSTNRIYRSFNIESGFRLFNGANDSVYGGLISDKMFYISVLSVIL